MVFPPKFWKSLAKAPTSFAKDQGSCLAMKKKSKRSAVATSSVFV